MMSSYRHPVFILLCMDLPVGYSAVIATPVATFHTCAVNKGKLVKARYFIFK